jgi:hypothetical protein
MQAVLLTQEQKQQIEGRKFTTDSYFLPIEDADGNWVVSDVEQDLCTNPDFDWIKHCPRIEYNPKPIPMPDVIPSQE